MPTRAHCVRNSPAERHGCALPTSRLRPVMWQAHSWGRSHGRRAPRSSSAEGGEIGTCGRRLLIRSAREKAFRCRPAARGCETCDESSAVFCLRVAGGHGAQADPAVHWHRMVVVLTRRVKDPTPLLPSRTWLSPTARTPILGHWLAVLQRRLDGQHCASMPGPCFPCRAAHSASAHVGHAHAKKESPFSLRPPPWPAQWPSPQVAVLRGRCGSLDCCSRWPNR